MGIPKMWKGILFSAMLLKKRVATTGKTNPKCVNNCVPSNLPKLQFKVRNVDTRITLSNQILPTSYITKRSKCMPTGQKKLYVEQ